MWPLQHQVRCNSTTHPKKGLQQLGTTSCARRRDLCSTCAAVLVFQAATACARFSSIFRGRRSGRMSLPRQSVPHAGVPLAAYGPQHPRRARRPDFLRPPDRILEDAGGSEGTAETCRGELAMLMVGTVWTRLGHVVCPCPAAWCAAHLLLGTSFQNAQAQPRPPLHWCFS